MKKFLRNLKYKEEVLLSITSELSVRWVWLTVYLLLTTLGVYLYNTKFADKSIITKVIFILIQLWIVWQNSDIIKPFFRNPFKEVGRPYTVSNVLWMYPFAILMVSVLFVYASRLSGLVSSNDPQNINEMKMSVNEYIMDIIILPLVAVEEESGNMLILVTLCKLFSKKIKHGWSLLSVITASVFFGSLHISAWGLEAGISRMFIHIPFLFGMFYFRSAWPSILAHFYQNWLASTSILYTGFSALFVKYGLLLCIVIWAYRYCCNYIKIRKAIVIRRNFKGTER
jgi:hypothetical protein